MGTPSSVVVRWRTSGASDSLVQYGPDPATLTSSVTLPALTTEHEVTISGLAPNTRYYYAIGQTTQRLAGGDANHFFVTSPVSGTAVPTRIWVLGDSGTADAKAAAVRNAYYSFTGSTATNLWLMLGDNAYNSGTDSEYQAAVFDMYPAMLRNSVLWPTIGNHDIANTSQGTGPYYDIFTLPKSGQAGGLASGTEAYYSFDYANIHFVCLDSFDVDLTTGSPMMTWLQNDVASTTQRWTIAFWHHPAYSKGSHDSDVDYELTQMRQVALPILEAAGVDLVLAGHSHSYERSFLIDGHYGRSSTLTASMKKNGGSGRADGSGAYMKPAAGSAPHAGAVYTVAGSSGFADGGFPLNHPAMYISLAVLGSLVLDVNDGRLDAKFVDNTSTVRDYFSIIKGPVTPLAVTTTSLPSGAAGTPYSQTLGATGGLTPYTWSITAGSLPAGLSLAAATGVISGTPTVSGARVFTVQVRDSSAPNVSAQRQLTISVIPPPVTVPTVVNLTQGAATTAITSAGLVVGTVTNASNPSAPIGSVVSQNPVAGSRVAAGSAVALVVSTGVTVPPVVGLTQAAATSLIASVSGLTAGAITTASSTTVTAGLVISQNPAGNTNVSGGSSVALLVSSGPPSMSTVPNVVSSTQVNAATAITNAGLIVGTVTTAPSVTVPAGSVISQSPTAGSHVITGSPVDLVVSIGVAPVVIGSQIAGTFGDATGHSAQSHLVYAANAGVWWLFTLTSNADAPGGSNHIVKSYRSSDPDLATATWTQSTDSPGAAAQNNSIATMSSGRALSIASLNNNAVDVIHAEVAIAADGEDGRTAHIRATVTGTIITWESWNYYDEPAAMWTIPRATSLGVSTGKFIHSGGPTLQQEVAANTRKSTNADTGASWTSGFSGVSVIDNSMIHENNALAFAPLANNAMLTIYDNGGGISTCYPSCGSGPSEPNLSNLGYKKSNADGSWSGLGVGSQGPGDGYVFSSDATIDQNDWTVIVYRI